MVCYCHSMGCCVYSKGPGVPVSSGAGCSDGMVMPNSVMGQRFPSCLHGPGLVMPGHVEDRSHDHIELAQVAC